MGYETKCRVRVDDGSGTVREADAATVLLETDELIVRGDARVRVPRTAIQQVTSRAGVVTVKSPSATVVLTLGSDAAEKWKKKLEEAPKLLIEKLDVKPDAKVWLLGIADAPLIEQVTRRAARVSNGSRAAGCDVVFVQVESDGQLDRIDRAAGAILDNGAIWVVHPKGKSGVADTTIFARAKQLGLAYVKVARVSETLTAEKLVRPLASRSTRTRRPR
jgi:hypothetical protein